MNKIIMATLLFLIVLETVSPIEVIHRPDRALRHHKHLTTPSWNQLHHASVNNTINLHNSDVIIDKTQLNGNKKIGQFISAQNSRRKRREEEILPYVGKGRLKPYRLPVTQETTTQTGINKIIPKYFLNSNFSSVSPGKRLSSKNKNEKARSSYSDISELNKNKNLTFEIFGDKKKSISSVAPRAIIKGGKNKHRVFKGQKPRKQGAKFNKNNVARGKIRKRMKSTRGTAWPKTISSTISETVSEVVEPVVE